ncbi:MAG TPA: serine hydrolase domain-containing protein [Candidatus Limnocylindria bacterium]|nr:serine hydrolase domain-containing protein [Candidatus Limnocylindria bacterium]
MTDDKRMTPGEADLALERSIRDLSLGMGMLTGVAVAYGNRSHAASRIVGLRREVTAGPDGFRTSPLPITQNTVFDLASLTKLFTLLCVLKLMERGYLRPGDAIADVDTRFRHLGDCPVMDCLGYRASLRTPQRVDAQESRADALAMVFQTRRVPLEGERVYSDMNALVLKHVVETAAGLPFYDAVREMVLQPAGMRETWARVPEQRRADLMDYNYEHRVLDGRYVLETSALPGLPHDPKARILSGQGDDLQGHAGLFSTMGDMCLLAQALLSGDIIPKETLRSIGENRTGYLQPDGGYRQFLGLLCFSKSPVARLSEVPGWMGQRAFALAGYTGNHLAIDPDLGVFDLVLGNRCHNRVSTILPKESAASYGLAPGGEGTVDWPDGRRVKSSFQYVYRKDDMLHTPAAACLRARGWMEGPGVGRAGA